MANGNFFAQVLDLYELDVVRSAEHDPRLYEYWDSEEQKAKAFARYDRICADYEVRKAELEQQPNPFEATSFRE